MQVSKLWNTQKSERDDLRRIFPGGFIAYCRLGNTHDYDIVEGPMANDTIWNYVVDYVNGSISRKQFWVLAEFRRPTHQISFHTLKAIDCLRFLRSEVKYD